MADLALGTSLDAEQREYVETVNLSADSLLTVINDILHFSKVEAGKIELELQDFDLRECLESSLKTLAVRADKKQLELLCDVAPRRPSRCLWRFRSHPPTHARPHLTCPAPISYPW